MSEDTFREKYKKLTPEQALALTGVKAAASNMEDKLRAFVHPGRELSLAITKLEEAVMWAVKGITA